MTPKRKKQKSSLESKWTIPPAIPDAELPNLMFKRDYQSEMAISEYVELEASDEKVKHAEKVTTEYVLGRKLEGWDVRTDKGRWWVITWPMNLYSQELFPSLDYTISFHVGIMVRKMSEPDPGVPPMEQGLLPAAWRRWEQAAEALGESEEAEDFQSVGMRCRECFVVMAKIMAETEMVPEGATPPKRSDVVNWCELIADHFAHGASAEYVRKYLKAISKSGWQFVNWLTHATGATRADAVLAVEITQHVLGTFGTALFRHSRGIPDQCPNCGSYRIEMHSDYEEGEQAEPVPTCRACGWSKI